MKRGRLLIRFYIAEDKLNFHKLYNKTFWGSNETYLGSIETFHLTLRKPVSFDPGNLKCSNSQGQMKHLIKRKIIEF